MKRKTIEVKFRSEIIKSAQHKLQGGPMKHRLEPKGGAKNFDYLKEYEGSDTMLSNHVNEHVQKIVEVFNQTFNEFDEYKISEEYDDDQTFVNVDKKGVKNFYLGIDIIFQKKENKKFTIILKSFDEEDCLKELTAKISSSPTGEFPYKEAATLLHRLLGQQIEVSEKLIKLYNEIV